MTDLAIIKGPPTTEHGTAATTNAAQTAVVATSSSATTSNLNDESLTSSSSSSSLSEQHKQNRINTEFYDEEMSNDKVSSASSSSSASVISSRRSSKDVRTNELIDNNKENVMSVDEKIKDDHHDSDTHNKLKSNQKKEEKQIENEEYIDGFLYLTFDNPDDLNRAYEKSKQEFTLRNMQSLPALSTPTSKKYSSQQSTASSYGRINSNESSSGRNGARKINKKAKNNKTRHDEPGSDENSGTDMPTTSSTASSSFKTLRKEKKTKKTQQSDDESSLSDRNKQSTSKLAQNNSDIDSKKGDEVDEDDLMSRLAAKSKASMSDLFDKLLKSRNEQSTCNEESIKDRPVVDETNTSTNQEVQEKATSKSELASTESSVNIESQSNKPSANLSSSVLDSSKNSKLKQQISNESTRSSSSGSASSSNSASSRSIKSVEDIINETHRIAMSNLMQHHSSPSPYHLMNSTASGNKQTSQHLMLPMPTLPPPPPSHSSSIGLPSKSNPIYSSMFPHLPVSSNYIGASSSNKSSSPPVLMPYASSNNNNDVIDKMIPGARNVSSNESKSCKEVITTPPSASSLAPKIPEIYAPTNTKNTTVAPLPSSFNAQSPLPPCLLNRPIVKPSDNSPSTIPPYDYNSKHPTYPDAASFYAKPPYRHNSSLEPASLQQHQHSYSKYPAQNRPVGSHHYPPHSGYPPGLYPPSISPKENSYSHNSYPHSAGAAITGIKTNNIADKHKSPSTSTTTTSHVNSPYNNQKYQTAQQTSESSINANSNSVKVNPALLPPFNINKTQADNMFGTSGLHPPLPQSHSYPSPMLLSHHPSQSSTSHLLPPHLNPYATPPNFTSPSHSSHHHQSPHYPPGLSKLSTPSNDYIRRELDSKLIQNAAASSSPSAGKMSLEQQLMTHMSQILSNKQQSPYMPHPTSHSSSNRDMTPSSIGKPSMSMKMPLPSSSSSQPPSKPQHRDFPSHLPFTNNVGPSHSLPSSSHHHHSAKSKSTVGLKGKWCATHVKIAHMIMEMKKSRGNVPQNSANNYNNNKPPVTTSKHPVSVPQPPMPQMPQSQRQMIPHLNEPSKSGVTSGKYSNNAVTAAASTFYPPVQHGVSSNSGGRSSKAAMLNEELLKYSQHLLQQQQQQMTTAFNGSLPSQHPSNIPGPNKLPGPLPSNSKKPGPMIPASHNNEFYSGPKATSAASSYYPPIPPPQGLTHKRPRSPSPSIVQPSIPNHLLTNPYRSHSNMTPSTHHNSAGQLSYGRNSRSGEFSSPHMSPLPAHPSIPYMPSSSTSQSYDAMIAAAAVHQSNSYRKETQSSSNKSRSPPNSSSSNNLYSSPSSSHQMQSSTSYNYPPPSRVNSGSSSNSSKTPAPPKPPKLPNMGQFPTDPVELLRLIEATTGSSSPLIPPQMLSNPVFLKQFMDNLNKAMTIPTTGSSSSSTSSHNAKQSTASRQLSNNSITMPNSRSNSKTDEEIKPVVIVESDTSPAEKTVDKTESDVRQIKKARLSENDIDLTVEPVKEEIEVKPLEEEKSGEKNNDMQQVEEISSADDELDEQIPAKQAEEVKDDQEINGSGDDQEEEYDDAASEPNLVVMTEAIDDKPETAESTLSNKESIQPEVIERPNSPISEPPSSPIDNSNNIISDTTSNNHAPILMTSSTN